MSTIYYTLSADCASVECQNSVLSGYLKLTKQDMPPRGGIDGVRKSAGRYFIGPKNVALERGSLKSIAQGYSVTEKTDGERALLFSDSMGRCYRIDNRLNVFDAGVQCGKGGCIFDGEYVKDKGVEAFYIFDTYFYDRQSVVSKHDLKYRQSLASNAGFTKRDKGVDVKVKKFLFVDGADSIFALSKQILESKHDTVIDGLVFTPVDAPRDLRDLGARTFKWKPPQDNTIDFLVKFDPSAKIKQGTPPTDHVYAQLIVGSNPIRDIDPVAILAMSKAPGTGAAAPAPHDYVERVFEECFLALDDDGKLVTAKGEVVASGMIVEMGMDDERRWVPKRIRDDKNQTLKRQKGHISGTANDYQVAVKTLRTIVNPVTQDMITGAAGIPDDEEVDASSDDVYYSQYQTAAQRQNSPLIGLRDFHNWVKGELLAKYGGRGKSLFDIGVGRGGDLMKWKKAGYDKVVGVDVSSANILGTASKNSVMEDCAYKRYADALSSSRHESIPKALFIVMDAGKEWDDAYIGGLTPDHMSNRYVAQVAFKSGVSSRDVKEPHMRDQWFGVVDKQFDVVSCQFAVHYFFKDEATLGAFCANLGRILKAGGYFIGTCMDGALVHDLLSSQRGEVAEALAPSDGKPLWRIQRKYDPVQYDRIDGSRNIGLCINNYIASIGKHFDEYLVDVRTLQGALAPHGLSLVVEESDLLRDLYSDYKIRGTSTAKMTPDIERYSFLNRQFVFRKE
jgi:hypothetical protein